MASSRPNSLKSGFKKPGKDGMNIFRGVMISGPPGIGKTTSAHLVAKSAGFTPIELNASDARSKKLVEVSSSLFIFWMALGADLLWPGSEQHEHREYIVRWVDGWWRGACSTSLLTIHATNVSLGPSSR